MLFISRLGVVWSSIVSIVGNLPQAAGLAPPSDHTLSNQQAVLGDSRNVNLSGTQDNGPQPFYLIAHRVLTTQGIYDALSHGANAIELDVSATKQEWYADHDDTPFTRGDT